jgi:hypothetical protein
MKTLDSPDPKLWRVRGEWFWRAHDANAGPHALELGPNARALLDELEMVFCVGAWAAVIILSWTIVEAEQRALERAGNEPHEAPDVDWLRERRNTLAHIALAADEGRLPDEKALETMAQGAVRVVFKTLFANAWK